MKNKRTREETKRFLKMIYNIENPTKNQIKIVLDFTRLCDKWNKEGITNPEINSLLKYV